MPGTDLKITPQLSIPESELVERFVRASGAGGQNINKVSTAVELRFDIAQSPSLPEALRARLLGKRDRRLTDEGVIVIDAQRFRTQDRNRQDARERLAAFIATGLSVPKSRIATKPTRASKTRRLEGKRARRRQAWSLRPPLVGLRASLCAVLTSAGYPAFHACKARRSG
ncbi:MAG: alternative ribosome rescue aminoacyl-tRNA hydrolase ArfB [Ralstonia sp.]|jgi:ribosome-associated protein|uniref:Peptide chain release factor 2 n=2 Tax=Ralstonia pickettii TaxID=329 RepID=A0ABM9ITR9_RALPI|nr:MULTISPECIES: alternative ribosome rescue aminoacyl-tRNA hydrolase ArfB [Ralstonia]CAJ0730649.1 Peptide chain release factor 2 [Ralstonia pickettii]